MCVCGCTQWLQGCDPWLQRGAAQVRTGGMRGRKLLWGGGVPFAIAAVGVVHQNVAHHCWRSNTSCGNKAARLARWRAPAHVL